MSRGYRDMNKTNMETLDFFKYEPYREIDVDNAYTRIINKFNNIMWNLKFDMYDREYIIAKIGLLDIKVGRPFDDDVYERDCDLILYIWKKDKLAKVQYKSFEIPKMIELLDLLISLEVAKENE